MTIKARVACVGVQKYVTLLNVNHLTDRTNALSGELSARQHAVLAAVCETLLPEIQREDDPERVFATGAQAAGTLKRVEAMIAGLPNPHDRNRLRALLSVLDSALLSFALGTGLRGFTKSLPQQREEVLKSWAHSKLALKRAGFQALKRLVHFAYTCWPIEDGSHPLWRATGYPGPLPQPATTIDALPTIAIESDTTLDCEVVVLGSGAGGGVVAGLLAEAGRDVIVLEKGGNPSSRNLTQVEGDMFQSLFSDGGTMMTQSGSMPILAGSCLGGGTVINWTSSFPLPERHRAEWDEHSGLSLFSGARFAESLNRVSQRVNVGTEWSTPGARDQILERGCRTLGWHVDAIPRNVSDCKEGLECGYCGYGCRHGAKNTTARTYLTSAAKAGTRMVAHCDVERVLTREGHAAGVVATVRGANGGQHQVTVNAKMVVAACGAIGTPALLLRSGLGNPRIGRGLHLHPVTAVVGVFPDRVEPWGGSLQTRYSKQFASLDGNFGFRLETGPIHFGLPASAFGWDNPRQWREDVSRLAHVGVAGILLRDRDTGRVKVSRSGLARVYYDVSPYDAAHVRLAVRAGAEVLAAAGAEEVFTLHSPPVRARPGGAGWLDRFMKDADSLGYRHCHMSYIAFHQMATAAMGGDPRRSVINEMGESHDVRGLFVADASAFPMSSGVNPMLTIMGIADHIARGILDRW